MNKEMIGYCGYNCSKCAARSDDKERRSAMVNVWKKYFGHTAYTEDNMPISEPCPGCKSDGKVADKQCQARQCAKGKKFDSRTECDEFPCKKVAPLLASAEGMFIFAVNRKGGITEEEFLLGMNQFCSMENVLDQLIDSGNIPELVRKNYSWGFHKKED